MRDYLRKLQREYLKPQQKLHLLLAYFLRKYIYRLKNSQISIAKLRSVDKMVRAAVRSFIHFPRNTPINTLHQNTSKEGLGVP